MTDKMTLEKAVEALKWYKNNCDCHVANHAEKALASLPEPKTEDEICDIIWAETDVEDKRMQMDIIRALRDAGCLYVMEG